MRRSGLFSRAFVVAGMLTALSLGSIALRPAQAEGQDLGMKRCAAYPYTVYCSRNRTGGPIGCFDTLCEAAAAGASGCKRADSACEP